jgi:hypothetical protein
MTRTGHCPGAVTALQNDQQSHHRRDSLLTEFGLVLSLEVLSEAARRRSAMTKYNWPLREEWAQRRRTIYADMDNPHPATKRLSAYATDDEIGASIAAMKAMLSAARRAERACEEVLGPLGRQRGESKRAYQKRLRDMSREERDAVFNGPAPDAYPPEVRDILKQLQADTVPWRWFAMGTATPPAPLDAIMARYEAAAKQADAKWHEEVAATAIDDAAWERELEWRRRCEDDEAHPERFRHRV